LFRAQSSLRNVKTAVLPDQIGVGDTRKLDALEQRCIRCAVAVIVNDFLIDGKTVAFVDEGDAPAVRLLRVGPLSLKPPRIARGKVVDDRVGWTIPDRSPFPVNEGRHRAACRADVAKLVIDR